MDPIIRVVFRCTITGVVLFWLKRLCILLPTVQFAYIRFAYRNGDVVW